MTVPTPNYSHYFWQGEKTRLRPWQLEDAELRFMASLDSQTVALHEDGIELPTSVELQKQRLEKIAGFKDDSMIRLAMENLDGVTIGWVSSRCGDLSLFRVGWDFIDRRLALCDPLPLVSLPNICSVSGS